MSVKLSFVERERLSGVQFIEAMGRTVAATFRAACQHDDIDPDAPFVVFSEGNHIALFYDRALRQYLDAMEAHTAQGYVGLSTKSRDLFRPARMARTVSPSKTVRILASSVRRTSFGSSE